MRLNIHTCRGKQIIFTKYVRYKKVNLFQDSVQRNITFNYKRKKEERLVQ
jgi:hypothetical protein